MLQQHLPNNNTYKQLSKRETKAALEQQLQLFLSCYAKYKNSITNNAIKTCFCCSLNSSYLSNTSVPQLYGTPKPHKALYNKNTIFQNASNPSLYWIHS